MISTSVTHLKLRVSHGWNDYHIIIDWDMFTRHHQNRLQSKNVFPRKNWDLNQWRNNKAHHIQWTLTGIVSLWMTWSFLDCGTYWGLANAKDLSIFQYCSKQHIKWLCLTIGKDKETVMVSFVKNQQRGRCQRVILTHEWLVCLRFRCIAKKLRMVEMIKALLWVQSYLVTLSLECLLW